MTFGAKSNSLQFKIFLVYSSPTRASRFPSGLSAKRLMLFIPVNFFQTWMPVEVLGYHLNKDFHWPKINVPVGSQVTSCTPSGSVKRGWICRVLIAKLLNTLFPSFWCIKLSCAVLGMRWRLLPTFSAISLLELLGWTSIRFIWSSTKTVHSKVEAKTQW